VVEALVTNFYHFGVLRELHSDQGWNLQSRLLHEVLQHLGLSETRTTPLHQQSDSMVKQCVKMVEQHLRKVISMHHRDWGESLPVFLLAYRASTQKTTGTTPNSMVFGRDMLLPYNL
jgi:hypothetical protein